MPTRISPLADVDPRAELGANVSIGPFCCVGPEVELGDDCVLDSHVAIVGNTTIGRGNRFWPNAVIGGEPQDLGFNAEADTRLHIGDDNMFREGVTVHRGAEKEDGVTRVGNGNLLMANAHVAHNCHIFNNTILVNGVLLGGHVHVHDNAIVSGNTAVHHYSTLGRLSFVSGGCRVPQDVPPFMLASGSDNPVIKTINVVGMKRAGISRETIRVIRNAHRLLFREHKKLDAAKQILAEQLGDVIPIELTTLLSFIEYQAGGNMGRGREGRRDNDPPETNNERRAA